MPYSGSFTERALNSPVHLKPPASIYGFFPFFPPCRGEGGKKGILKNIIDEAGKKHIKLRYIIASPGK
jgi:hypothetical protein